MTAAVIALDDARFTENRYATIETLRARHYYARTPDGHVIFLNQIDVMEVLRCIDFQFTFNLIDNGSSPYLAQAIEHELLNMHGERHRRLSRLVKRALRDRVIVGMQEKIDAIVETLIAQLPDNTEIDFCSQFADPLPARILGPMFDLPYEQVSGLNNWIRVGGRKIDALQSGVGIDAVEQANRQLHNYLRALLLKRRQAPGGDLFSELMMAEIDGDRLNDDEVVYLAAELASAGVDTTRAQLPLILKALLDHPRQLDKLQADPTLAMKAVDEGMRYAPLPWVLPHRATRSFRYRDIDFREGDLVFAMVPAANRDPAAISDPDRFDLTRARARHFAFGHGMHVCPGLKLARMEMASALAQLTTRLNIQYAATEPVWVAGQQDRTLQSLHLKIRRRA